MSPLERNLLLKVKRSARKHLQLITAEPDHYLRKLRYAMDFVWAKFAFCFLLLLKLSRLMPESAEENRILLEEGNRMLEEISSNTYHRHGGGGAEGGGNETGSNNNDSNIYMQILKLSIEKFGKTADIVSPTATTAAAAGTNHQEEEEGGERGDGGTATGSFWELFDAQSDLQSFVPRQFVFEWDFPGLNLFYLPTAWQDFFSDFSLNV